MAYDLSKLKPYIKSNLPKIDESPLTFMSTELGTISATVRQVIDALRGIAADVSSGAAADAAAMAIITANVAANTTNIATNTTNIATNTSAIGTNTTNIATNTASIAAHESAWTTYTPTVTASAGTFTSVSAAGAYKTIGKLVHFTCSITITTVGTASGAMLLPLPIGTTARAASVYGLAHNLGKSVGYRLLSGDTTGAISFYDNTSAIAAGNVIVVTGTYERV